MKETSRDVSFCAHALTQQELFIVPDATKDPRFAHNPMVVAKPKIRFYAGAPLITPDGYALGTLCVIDQVPRQLHADQRQALRILARHVVTQLELRRRSRELAAAHQEKEKLKNDLEKVRAELERTRRKILSSGVKQKTSRRRNSPRKNE